MSRRNLSHSMMDGAAMVANPDASVMRVSDSRLGGANGTTGTVEGV